MKKKRTGRMKKAALAVLLILCLTGLLNWLTEGMAYWKPDYPKTSLEAIAGQETLTEEDYRTIFLQTGLGRAATDVLLAKAGERRGVALEKYQDNFFSQGDYDCRTAAFIVHEERLRDGEGNAVKGFEVADLRNGDILITKSTHTLGWRHGHAAIVTDASKGETLEAILLGSPSILQHISKWQTYPSFIQLRLKETEGSDGTDAADVIDADRIAAYAKKEILDIPYGLFTGVLKKAPEKIKTTQCAHLVWYPYERFGYDLDSDGTWMVTPKDIANSRLLEVVQVYGVNPEEIWP